MYSFLLHFAANVLVILGLSYLLNSFEVANTESAAVFILILTILNWTIVPIIKFFAFPINFLTLGLFNAVLNLAVISMAIQLSAGRVQILTSSNWSTLLIIVVIAAALSVSNGIVAKHVEKDET